MVSQSLTKYPRYHDGRLVKGQQKARLIIIMIIEKVDDTVMICYCVDNNWKRYHNGILLY